MALAVVEDLRFAYGRGAGRALEGVSLQIEDGEHVALFGPSGSGKSTLLRALGGLVPHFHGGVFEGRVVVDGWDMRRVQPSELAGVVASVFQDPEDQVVMTRVANEVGFGLENLGTPPRDIRGRIEEALRAVAAEHLAERPVTELSSGELQRVCLASALALRPRLLLAVVVSEQRPARPLAHCDRVVFMDGGRILLDASRATALEWLGANRPLYLPHGPEVLCHLDGVSFAYGDRRVLEGVSLDVHRGEIVALTGANGSGKTTLAKIVAGLLEPSSGTIERGRAAYLSQDPGRYVVAERAEEEVALGADRERARAALERIGLAELAERHPRDLSSGERERLALASVLVTEPDLLVLDEPTRGVDPERKAELARLLRADAPRRATLVVTHDLVWAAEVADRVVSIDAVRERVVA